MDGERAVRDIRGADGYVGINDYAALGDGRGVAMVAVDGAIDWWAIPQLASPPPFSALLDPDRGGRIELSPTDTDTTTVRRRYLPDTNVLETTFTTSTGTVCITDCLNSGSAGALPWSELGRRIEGVSGAVELRLAVIPGDGMRRWEPWVESDNRGPIVHAGTVTLGVRCSPEIALTVSFDRVEATFSVGEGERRVVGVVGSDADPLFLCGVDSIDDRIDLTAQSWRQWSKQVHWSGDGRELMVRSALALKTLLIASTGAIAAAATTSLPERVGGPKNWDYRYCWIRDAAFTIDALAVLGLQEEVHAAVAWLLHAVRDNGPDVHVMYTLSGTVPDTIDRPDLPGYRGSRPVRVGNDAASQTQLGLYGDLFGTVADWVFGGHVLDVGSARQLSDLADRCADVWRHDDAGIWELHTDRPYTSSKMNCWRALDAAARLAEAGQLTGTGKRWRAEAQRIRSWVQQHCWSSTKQAYTFYAGTEDLDASVLLGAQFGFDDGPTMSSTIDAIGTELGAGPLLYRYSGVRAQEATFTACAFWRVHAMVCVGRHREAAALQRQLPALVASPLGLMSEMTVADTGDSMGNIPQALSHLAFIRAVNALREATDRPDGDAHDRHGSR
ncbi:glycoside hydrolase family 15 protein [Mycolicibacterium aichiense]|uniref:glycoside hydrolase family 15 protein n=1 Tax=Mycolicibacterium aichiense TaxID=1799 RepID=UPI003D67D359